jgi:hypothetical protein
VLAGALTPAIASAQESTPAAEAVPCDVEPISVDDLVSVFFFDNGTPIAQEEFPTPFASVDDLPQGTPVDDETLSEIEAVVREWASCYTSNDTIMQAFALMTPDAIRPFGFDVTDPTLDTPEEAKAFLEAQLAATPEPGMESEPFPIEGPVVAFTNEDGSVGSVWDSDGDLAYIELIDQDGQWLINAIIDIADQD